jgi:Raf kinase inhibitor-like YbhB/YbcL family protein
MKPSKIMIALLVLSLSMAASVSAWAQPRLKLESPAFASGSAIPAAYTCVGADKSPPLSWSGAPDAAKSIALIVDDPDAPHGTWVHWVLYDVPAHAKALPEGIAKNPRLPDGTKQGVNDFGRIGYNGPCPPGGRPHHYHFRLFVLDSVLDVKPGATAAELEATIRSHVAAKTELVGTFGR